MKRLTEMRTDMRMTEILDAAQTHAPKLTKQKKAQKASEAVCEKLAAAKMKHVSSEGGRHHHWRRGRKQEEDNEEKWLQCLRLFSARDPETRENAMLASCQIFFRQRTETDKERLIEHQMLLC